MLDDASKEGLEEALSLLPVSEGGSGLLVTSYLIKTEDAFRGLLALRADGAAAHVAVQECSVLSDEKAMELFHLCGFKFCPEDAALRAEVANEIKVCLPRAHLNHACAPHRCCAGHGSSPRSCSAFCGVEPPPTAEVGRQVCIC